MAYIGAPDLDPTIIGIIKDTSYSNKDSEIDNMIG